MMHEDILFEVAVSSKQDVFAIGRERGLRVLEGPDFVFYYGGTLQRFKVEQTHLITTAEVYRLVALGVERDIAVAAQIGRQLFGSATSISCTGIPIGVARVSLVK